MTTSGTLATRLQQLQSFKEVTWGTPGTPTAKWMGLLGPASFKPHIKNTLWSDEARGSLQNAFLNAVLEQGGEFSIKQIGTFEDIIFMLMGGLQSVSPTGAGPYVYASVAGTTAAYSIQPYTFVHAYDVATIQAAGAIITKWGISGESKKNWETNCSGFFQTYNATGTLASLSDRTVEPILFPGETALFMDAAAGTIGSTAFANVFKGFKLDVENTITPVFGSDQKYPISWTYGLVKAKLSIKLLWTSAVKTYVNGTLQAGLPGLIQVKATSGTKIAQLDFAGVLADDPEDWGDEEGAIIKEVSLESRYDTGAFANSLKTTITNSVASLP